MSAEHWRATQHLTMDSMARTPVETLHSGAEILSAVMKPHGFVFEFRDEGVGSGGYFTWGEFVREDRRLELHYRNSLGLVQYHLGPQHVSHEGFTREIGVLGRNRYPSFSHEAQLQALPVRLFDYHVPRERQAEACPNCVPPTTRRVLHIQ